MSIDWSHRRLLERRMRGPAFRTASRALAAAIVARSAGPIRDAARRPPVAAALPLACTVQGVAGHLEALGDLDGLPEGFVATVRREAAHIAARAVRLDAELRRIGAAARAAGLTLAPLKGTFLRSERYESSALRPSADLDLLADPEDVAAWRAVLHACGYTDERVGARHVSFSRPDQQPVEADGDHPDHPCPVELHTAISARVFGRVIDVTDDYRRDLRDGTLLGMPARVPGDAALALHLVLHAAESMLDRGLRLAQVIDLGVLDDAEATCEAVRRRLPDAAWAVVHLCTRDVPGLMRDGWLAGQRSREPLRWRQAIIDTRPGLLTGDPYRVATLIGEVLLSGSLSAVVGRAVQSWRERRDDAR